jgi:hypothetical protein
MTTDEQEREAHFQKWVQSCFVQPKENRYIPDMRFDLYHDSPGLNGSTFLKQNPMHMKFEAMRPREPDYGLSLGEIVHMAILEPDFFDTDGTVEERFTFSPTKTLDSKAALGAFAADPHKPLVTPDMVEKAKRMKEAVYKNDLAKQLLSVKADRELSGFAWDEEQQVLLKTRVDFRPKKGNYLLDLKTTGSVEEAIFWSEVKKWQYHAKAAMYLDVDSIISKELPKELFLLVAISGPKGPSQSPTDAPYDVQVFDIAAAEPVEFNLVEEGHAIYRNRLAMFCNAARTNHWEGHWHQSAPIQLTTFKPRSLPQKPSTENDA